MKWISFTTSENSTPKKLTTQETKYNTGMLLVAENDDSATIDIGTYDNTNTWVSIATLSENNCFDHGRGVALYASVTGMSSNGVKLGYAG